jgi:hypothetical protein
LQREIDEGLNVVESWNGANAVIFYGKGGDIAANRRDEQELSVLCLRIRQAALACVNTLMVLGVLAGHAWAGRLRAEDKRGLTALLWAYVAPTVRSGWIWAAWPCMRTPPGRSGDTHDAGSAARPGPAHGQAARQAPCAPNGPTAPTSRKCSATYAKSWASKSPAPPPRSCRMAGEHP